MLRPLFLLLLLLVGCASKPYQAKNLVAADFLQRAQVQEQGELAVSVAVPTAQETLALTGIDLYAQGIQPVWLNVTNRSDSGARLTTWSIDRDYYAPIEVAYMNRKGFSSEGYKNLQRWFHDNAMPRKIPPGESRSGLVFTQERPGSKGINLTLIHRQTAANFTFFIPMPGFVADFMQVDFANLYSPEQQRELTLKELRQVLEEELPCCATDESGEKEGVPLNAVLVGSGQAVRRAMLRGGWLETPADASVATRARQHMYHGRRPDAIFSQLRPDGLERIVLQLWMTPWRVQGEPAWAGFVYYFLDDDSPLSWFDAEIARDMDFFRHFTRESLIADVDSAQRFLYQNLWYNGSLEKIGTVKGVGKVSIDAPRKGFTGGTYFTEGYRLVAFLSEELNALDEVVYLTDPVGLYPGGEPGELFRGRQVPPPNDRIQIQHSGPLKVSTGVPSREEARDIFNVDLYRRNIQPVWVEVENNGDSALNLTPMGIDKAYFSPREAANRSRNNPLEAVAQQYEQTGHKT
ncbi:LssY C-terminal domain-containing protein, partial [Pseudohalioglobus lutimaris]